MTLLGSGKEREADGCDETVLGGERGDSLDAAGFEHPYGRGNVPPARVVALSPDALAQVRGSLPQAGRMPVATVHGRGQVLLHRCSPRLSAHLASLQFLESAESVHCGTLHARTYCACKK